VFFLALWEGGEREEGDNIGGKTVDYPPSRGELSRGGAYGKNVSHEGKGKNHPPPTRKVGGLSKKKSLKKRIYIPGREGGGRQEDL